jgi:hypothetical protein
VELYLFKVLEVIYAPSHQIRVKSLISWQIQFLIKNHSTVYDKSGDQVCVVHSERGLGCALIKGTLGSGNPGRVGNLEGGENKGAMGDKGD